MHTRNLEIDQLTGEIRCDGAGEIVTVRRERANGFPRNDVETSTAPAAAGLVYLHVAFEHGLTGNHLAEKRHVAFHEQVQAVHGPVSSWNDWLDPDQPDGLGEKGVVLDCDKLTVTEFAPVAGDAPASDKPIEFEAEGNARVESRSFTALAARLTYALAKDMLVLEGDGRSDAEIWRQSQGTGPGAHTAARKITYLRSRDHIVLNDWEGGELTNIIPRQKGE
jgi:hypothetical protein